MSMAGMNLRPWNASDWLGLFVMWIVMMVGMMLPSAAAVILLVLGAYRLRGDSQARLASIAFMGGYLLVWAAFSAFASLGQLVLHRAALLSDDMRLHSTALSGVILLLAGVYQWVPQQPWDRTWTDAALYEKYGISAEEQAYIESMVRPMESAG